MINVILLPTIFVAGVKAQTTPKETARKLYNLVVKERISGLPDSRQMQLIRPYLSSDLRLLFSKAQKEQSAFSRKHPDEKPPWADGCLFSCAFEGPRSPRAGRARFSGRFAYVSIHQGRAKAGRGSSWIDTLVLIKEKERWVVWDVRMGCNWPFRMGPTLRAMLDDG
jgi:hypothetical protein